MDQAVASTAAGAGPGAADRRSLRIALVTETYPPEVNGVAMTTQRMVDGLLGRGHAIQLVRPRQGPSDRAASGRRFEQVLVAGLTLPNYRDVRVGLPAVGLLERGWEAWRPDIVHVVTEGPLGWAALVAARRLRLPAVSDFHTNFHAYSTHYGFGLLRGVIGGYLRRFHNRSLVTFVPTRQLRAELEREGYRAVEVVARGVDTALFDPARRSAELRRSWGLGPDDLAVLHVGRLAPEKNLPLVLSAFEAIRQRRPDARLVLVGDGPARSRLEGSHPAHLFAGMRTGPDLAAHYASGDLFLFPSQTETFGNVTLEAMASGLAVVAYDYAAAREHLVHAENGLLAGLGDAGGFERNAVRAATDPRLMAAIRREARLTAERVSWEHVIDALSGALVRVATAPVAARALGKL
jgi:glycosyltransferase involved in cell wall biosynthesis